MVKCEWLIGANTQNIPHRTREKTNTCKAPLDEG